jgi:hypothetical protein
MHLSNYELEVRSYGIVELECFKFKLQKPKLVKLDWMWRENGKCKVKQEDFKYNLVPKCCLVQAFVKLSIRKALLWDFLASFKTPSSFPCFN